MCLALICAGLMTAIPDAPPEVHRAYQEARDSAGRSSEDQVRLALWCESHGLTRERLNHLAVAVLADPANATARGLMGLVAYQGRFLRPEAVAERTQADPILAEYDARRAKADYTAEGQWSMGLWAEEHGLKDQARAHFTAVIRLDPRREAAWKRLGYMRRGGRWVTDEQLAAEKAEAEAQEQADRHWKPLLEKYRAMLDQPSRREEAEAALLAISDPRAVPSIGRVFGSSEATQPLAVRLLGQIDSQGSSRGLAYLSISARSSEARRMATETLRGRDPREYANLLIEKLRDPIKYEVRPVGGPGSPGVLFVEGKRYDVQRRYSPPPAPNIGTMAGDWITYDGHGLPLVNRIVSINSSDLIVAPGITRDQAIAMIAKDSAYLPVVEYLGSRLPIAGMIASDHAARQRHYSEAVQQLDQQWKLSVIKDDPHATVNAHRIVSTQTNLQIPVGEMMIDAQRSAMVAQQQLAQDAAAIDRHNETVRASNERVIQALAGATGQDLGANSKDWKEWLVDQMGFRMQRITSDTPKPVLYENVPLNYLPQTGPSLVVQYQSSTAFFRRYSCFGAGTVVQTISGPRPIESLKVGDSVLTQSTDTGALGYRPILVVHHNPPSPTFRVRLAGEPIISSHFHRFWVAGKGWVMARDLKPGDPIRTLGGVSPVESVEPDAVQPVFNLDVAEDADFFAGAAAALVHDNTLPDPRLAPFDAAPVSLAGRPE